MSPDTPTDHTATEEDAQTQESAQRHTFLTICRPHTQSSPSQSKPKPYASVSRKPAPKGAPKKKPR